MKRLDVNFKFTRYGLDTRLVCETDAEFILRLRTNERLTRHIHSTDDDIEKQISWIKEYKKREEEGREYYFIYFKDGEPIGVNRVSNIYEYYGLGGSWLCLQENDMAVSLSTDFVFNDICFEIICLDYIVFDVRKANTHVWKFHLQTGAVKIGESEVDNYYYLYRKNYYAKREKMLKLINI